MKYRNILLSLGLASILVACSGEDNSSEKEYSATVERGKVLTATVKDANGQIAKSKSVNSNIYYFENKPTYPIIASGGFIDLDGDGKKSTSDVELKVNLKSCSKNVTPLNTYLSKNGCSKVEENTKELAQNLDIDDVKSLSKLPSEQERLKGNKKALLLTNATFLALLKNTDESGNIKENINLQDDIVMFKGKIESTISDYSELNAKDLENKIIKTISKIDKSLEDKVLSIKAKEEKAKIEAEKKAAEEQARIEAEEQARIEAEKQVAKEQEQTSGTFALSSSDIKDNGILPNEFRANMTGQCNGGNKIPSLSWSNIPVGTKSFVITMIDMAKQDGKPIYFPHWVIADIPADVNSLAKNDMKQTSIEGKTYYKDPNAFGGACPPSLTEAPALEENHLYKITIYALKGMPGGFESVVAKYANVPQGRYNYYLDNPNLYLGKASITVYAKNSDFPH